MAKKQGTSLMNVPLHIFEPPKSQILKCVYSEKANKFCEISTLLLSVCTEDKGNVEILQNLVAFSEYTNFTKRHSTVNRIGDSDIKTVFNHFIEQKNEINFVTFLGSQTLLR